MLAKSRCNQIARLAALSAPDIFLPRLLLCCGISSVSLLSMIDRLGDMGTASPDSNKYYTQLLSPSAVSEWGSGYQIGGRRAVARKLIGRLSAYLQLNGKDKKQEGRGRDSSPFLSWLIEYCSVENSKKPRVKLMARSRPPLPDHLKQIAFNGALSKLLIEDAGDDDKGGGTHKSASVSVEASPAPQFSTARKEHQMSSSRRNCLLAIDAIKSSIGSNDVEALGCMAISIAQAIEDCSNSVNNAPNEAAMNLLGELSKTDTSHPPVLVNAALKWLPFLSSISWDDSLCETAFGSNNTDTALRGMIEQCAKCWNEEQISGCQAWILNQVQSDNGISRFSPQCMIDFLVRTSNQSPVMQQPFAGVALPPFSVVSLHEHAAAAVKLALEGARIENENSTAPGKLTCTPGSYLGRDMVPNWLVLLQLVSRCSKKHLALVANSLVSELATDGWESDVYPPVLLRLYSSLPSMMNLGDPKLRGILIKAAGDLSLNWLDWRCPLDDQIRQMIATLSSNWNQRLLQSMIDVSKRQPLLLLRHLGGIATVLIQDGDVSSGTFSDRVRTTAAQGIAVAKTRRGVIKVTVSHWGYSFNEPLYSSVCEIITSLPTEVAFSCGLKLGLLDIFGTFVKLIWTQHSLGCPEHTVRIRTRLASLLASFNSFNPLAWAEWMESRLQGLEKCGPVREIVQLCEIKVHV